ncbi:MAG: hypothetical protein ACPGVU_13485 [Limisphaerales bacterium]
MKSLRVFFTTCLFAAVQTLIAQTPPALGVKITCPYMPYSATSSQIIYLSNPTTNSVNVVVKGFDDTGTEWDLGMVAAAPGRRVTKLSNILGDALNAKGFTGGKMALEFTLTNAAVQAYFSYNAGTVRGFVEQHRELFPLSGASTNAPAPPALGVKITCSYMPYSFNASQIIYLSNPTTNSVDVSVKAFDETGSEWNLGVVAQATGRRVTKLAPILNTKLQEMGFTAGKINFEFDLRNSAIIPQFEYNAGSVRAYVQPITELYVLPPTDP